jgi:hypothetical protein
VCLTIVDSHIGTLVTIEVPLSFKRPVFEIQHIRQGNQSAQEFRAECPGWLERLQCITTRWMEGKKRRVV